jgi:hypothetical protein
MLSISLQADNDDVRYASSSFHCSNQGEGFLASEKRHFAAICSRIN